MPDGWIVPDPVEVTGEMPGQMLHATSDLFPAEADLPAAEAQAYAGLNQGSPFNTPLATTHLQTSHGAFDTDWQAVIDLGFSVLLRSQVVNAGTYSYPPGAVLDPDEDWSLISVSMVGRMVWTDPALTPAALRSVPGARWTGTEVEWMTPAEIAAETTVIDGPNTASDGTDPAMAGLTYHDFDVPLTFDGPEAAAVVLASLESYNPTGATWAHDLGSEVFLRSVESGAEGPQWLGLLQPPRYRLPGHNPLRARQRQLGPNPLAARNRGSFWPARAKQRLDW